MMYYLSLKFDGFQIVDTNQLSKTDPTITPMGQGVITTRPFKMYEFVTEYKGEVLPNEEGQKRYKDDPKNNYFELGSKWGFQWYVDILK